MLSWWLWCASKTGVPLFLEVHLQLSDHNLEMGCPAAGAQLWQPAWHVLLVCYARALPDISSRGLGAAANAWISLPMSPIVLMEAGMPTDPSAIAECGALWPAAADSEKIYRAPKKNILAAL